MAAALEPAARCLLPAQARPWSSSPPLLDELAGTLGLSLTEVAALHVVHRGDDHYGRLLDAVAGARREIAVEMYQFHLDAVGNAVAEALEAAARRGVRVRLHVDAWGSHRFAGRMPALRRAGVDARWYSPWRPWNSPFRRTHRKLIVVDRTWASIGGMNLTEEFSERCSGPKTWRDVSLWLRGAAAAALSDQFDAAWHGRTWRPAAPAPPADPGAARCLVIGGRDGRQGHAAAYAALVDAARHEILVSNAYFMPDPPFRARLAAAAARGVEVTVVVPRNSDIAAFKHASRRLFNGLLRAGVRIIERDDRMVHAKVAVVDRRVAAVGSTNINRRSFYRNSETLVLTDDPATVRGVARLILDEGRSAGETLALTSWTSHPDRRRLAELLSASVHVLF